MTYANAMDVAARWGKDMASLDSAVVELINVRLADAERMIARRIPDLDVQVAADANFMAEVVRVEAEAVLRVARNPEGFLSEGDGSYQYQLIQSISSGKLEIMANEWADLGMPYTGMFFIDPTPMVG